MIELRWVHIDLDGKKTVYSQPTATDSLEFAEKQLNCSEEFTCSKSDERLKSMSNIKKLLTQK